MKKLSQEVLSIRNNGIFPKDYTEEYIRKHADYLNWKMISNSTNMDIIINLADDFCEEMDWFKISRRKITEELVRKNSQRVIWTHISNNAQIKKFSEQFFIDFENKLNWDILSFSKTLSEDFINKHRDRINWVFLLGEKKYSEDFLRRNLDKINWLEVLQKQTLSESFIEEFSNKINWRLLAGYQVLSMPFIRKHLNKLKITTVLTFQTLNKEEILEIIHSEEFMIQYQNGVSTLDSGWINFEKNVGSIKKLFLSTKDDMYEKVEFHRRFFKLIENGRKR